MQFHDYQTHFQIYKHRSPRDPIVKQGAETFYQQFLKALELRSQQVFGSDLRSHDPFSPLLMQTEQDWHAAQRPYYNLWPSIIPALTGLRLDADASHFKLPLDHLLIRFPVRNNPLSWTDSNGLEHSVRIVMAENVNLHTSEGQPGRPRLVFHKDGQETPVKRGIAFWIDGGETVDVDPQKPHDAAGQVNSLMYKHLVCDEGKSIEWSFDHIPAHPSSDLGLHYPDQIVRDVARIVCTLCLMAEDKELVEPIVLKADEEKWDKSHDSALVEKAKRRGNFGFNVGRDIEVAPHVRAACPAALYWTGKGRKIPRIRFRRGSVVHRKRLASVPTGFFDKE
jgi:hypothetical protein